MKIRCSLSCSFLSIGNLFCFPKRNKNKENKSQELGDSSANEASKDPNANNAPIPITLLVPNNNTHFVDQNSPFNVNAKEPFIGSDDSLVVNKNFLLPQPLEANQNPIFITSSNLGLNGGIVVSSHMNPNINLGQTFPLPQLLMRGDENPVYRSSSDLGFNVCFYVSRDMNPNANLDNQNFPLPQPINKNNKDDGSIIISSAPSSIFSDYYRVPSVIVKTKSSSSIPRVLTVRRVSEEEISDGSKQWVQQN